MRALSGGSFRNPVSMNLLLSLSDRRQTTAEDASPALPDTPHAVTTPDNSAWPLGPMFGTALADVPEEDENTQKRRSSRPPSATLRNARSTPDIQSTAKKQGSSHSLRRAQDAAVTRARSNSQNSQQSDTLSGPWCISPVPGMSGVAGSKRSSVRLRAPVSGSWEDDIDYCYEHMVEANCDYEWDRRSLGDECSFKSCDESNVEQEKKKPSNGFATPPGSPNDRRLETRGTDGTHNTDFEDTDQEVDEAAFSGIIRPSMLVVPDLEPPSTMPSSATTSEGSETLTPSRMSARPMYPIHMRGNSQSDKLKVLAEPGFRPSLLIRSDYDATLTHETPCDEVIADDDILRADHMSQLYENIGVAYGDIEDAYAHTFETSVYDHEEAVMLSRAASIALRHRGSMAGSPQDELDLVVRQLNEHIASLSESNANSPVTDAPRRQSFGGELVRPHHHSIQGGPIKSASSADVRGIAAHHKRFDSNASTITNSTDSATVFGGERSVSSHNSGGTGYYVRAKTIDESKHILNDRHSATDTPSIVVEDKHHSAYRSDDQRVPIASGPHTPLSFF